MVYLSKKPRLRILILQELSQRAQGVLARGDGGGGARAQHLAPALRQRAAHHQQAG